MSKQLVTVQFHGDVLEAVEQDGKVWVGLRRCCENLGLSMQGQLPKLQEKSWATIKEILMVADDGKQRSISCIELDCLPLWLATIIESKVKPQVREKLARYQKEAARVLADHFFGRKPAPGHIPVEAIESLIRKIVGELRPIGYVPAAPRFSVHERCRWKGWPTTSAGQRAEVRRLANILLMDRHGETPDVAGGPGSPCMYFGHQLAVLDEAIDRVRDEYAREERGGASLWE